MISYPLSHAVIGTDAIEKRFDIPGNYSDYFPEGHQFSIEGNSQGNDGVYTVDSCSYLSGSSKTRIIVIEPVNNNGGGGQLLEQFVDGAHDMPRAATHNGESIDYIRRDALHYHQYDMEPWLEIAISSGSVAFKNVCTRLFSFLEQQILNPPEKHYEFNNSSDSFDALRWQASQPEYLQPNSMYIPDKSARVIFSYLYLHQQTNPQFQIDDRLLNFALRSDVLPSHWYYYFRWIFGGQYG